MTRLFCIVCTWILLLNKAKINNKTSSWISSTATGRICKSWNKMKLVSDLGECVLGVQTNKSEIDSSKQHDSAGKKIYIHISSLLFRAYFCYDLLFRACLLTRNRWSYESKNLGIRELEFDQLLFQFLVLQVLNFNMKPTKVLISYI